VGLGKVFPILRGAGINQSLLQDYARLIAAGDWCHVYPEGGIWQEKTLGGRKNGQEQLKGKLKWGVGKLIAHAPNRPIVIVFYFSGTEHLTPMDLTTRKILSYIPTYGHKVKIRFSEMLNFEDLIRCHEATYGPLWKYQAHSDEEDRWISSESDCILYAQITARIEQVLIQLNEQSNQEEEE